MNDRANAAVRGSNAAHDPVLDVRGLSVDYASEARTVSAIDDVSFSVAAGEILGLVGESGCGKSTVAAALLGLLPANASLAGSIRFRGEELVGAAQRRLRELRGERISLIVQDPSISLDPTFSIGEQIAETVRAHADVSRAQAKRRALDVLAEVGIPDPRARYDDPPHRLSGGMRQRVVIAAALVNDPTLIIADEPTTALDVTLQAQVLALLLKLRRERDTAIVLITHDLGVVASVADRVVTMYAGQISERATVESMFADAAHPYTRALLGALPSAERAPGALRAIGGSVPDLSMPLPGCRFAERCPLRHGACEARPPVTRVGARHDVACWAVASGDGS